MNFPRAITELKQELLERAEEGVTASGGGAGEGKSDGTAAAAQRQRVAELNGRVERMARQLKSHAEREVASLAQVKALKEELARKASMLIKVREDKSGSGSAKVRFSPAVAEAKEKEELRKTIRRLEERLRDENWKEANLPMPTSIQSHRCMFKVSKSNNFSMRIVLNFLYLPIIVTREVNQAERPLEDAPKAGISAEEKALKNAEEVARWDEKKKWELKVEHFKRKLEEANEEVSKVSKSNKGLRDMVARMERERIVLEGRARASSRGADRAGQLQASQEAARERDRLKEELEAVKHERLMGEAQGVETLRLRNKLLQVWRSNPLSSDVLCKMSTC